MDDQKFKETQESLARFAAEAMVRGIEEQVCRPGNFKASLTSEDLEEMVNRFHRENGRFYVLSTESLPDDCYGIIYLRPEDAAKVNPAAKPPREGCYCKGGSQAGPTNRYHEPDCPAYPAWKAQEDK